MTKPNPSSTPLPAAFRSQMVNLYGQEGANWLTDLPSLRGSLRERWSLQNTKPLPQLLYNYLEYADSPQHGPVVLKLGFVNRELLTEIQYLDFYRGLDGAVQLLDHDLDLGAILLERVLPGQDLTSISDDEQATRIAARSMMELRRPAPEKGDYPSLEDWFQAFSRYRQSFPDNTGPLPSPLIDQASQLAQELLANTDKDYLLHGDFHHGNLLYREDGNWVVIDPKGVRGDFAAEIGPFLFNPFPGLYQQANIDKIIDRRIKIFSEVTGLDPASLAAWSFCRTVLAAVWSVEDGDLQIDPNFQIINILKKLVN